MTLEYEAAYHVEQVRLRGGLPSTDSRFTTARLLSLLTDELRASVASLVHGAKSDHGIVPHNVATPAVAAGSQGRYAIPSASFAGTLRDVHWLDASGEPTPLSEQSLASPTFVYRMDKPGHPAHYAIRGSTVILSPPPSTAGTLVMPYYQRPSRLVLVDTEPATEGAIRLTGGTYNASARTLALYTGVPPTSLQPASTAVAVDLVSGKPGFENLYSALEDDVFVEELAPTSWRFTISNVASNPVPGVSIFYLCVAGESPVPQVPVELFPLLHARTALVAVPSTGDTSQAGQALAAQVRDLEAKAKDLLRPRVESGGKPLGLGLDNHPMLQGMVR